MEDNTYTHGFLVFPISLYLIYNNNNLISEIEPKPELKVFYLISVFLGFWFLAKIVDVQLILHLSLILIIISSIWLVFGAIIFQHHCFPLLFLLFAVPAGNSLKPILMNFTADIATSLVKLSGISIYREGLFFTLPTGSWSVVEACSGVNYLIASIVLGTLFSYMTFSSFYKRSIFIFTCIIVSILANGIRAYGIVMIGHYSQMKYGTGGDHTFYGWLFYGVVITSLFYIGAKFSDPLSTKTSSKSINNPAERHQTFKIIQSLGLLIILILGTKMISASIISLTIDNETSFEPPLPPKLGQWQQFKDYRTNWKPLLKNPSALLSNTYKSGKTLVDITIGFYSQQKQGQEVVSSANRLVKTKDSKWKNVSSYDYQQGGYYLRESRLSSHERDIIVWQWYEFGNLRTPSPLIAKIFNAMNIILYQRNSAAFITIATPLAANIEQSREQLLNFMSTILPAIEKSMTE